MLVIPSVDILEKKCVQLVGGDPSTGRVYGDPLEWARKWESEGAEILHVVDLDGALGRGNNLSTVERLCRGVSIPVQVGGGIRSLDTAQRVVEAGASKIVTGTAAIKNPEFASKLVRELGGERVIIALDTKGGKVAVEGWQRTLGTGAVELARTFERMGVWGFLFTAVDVEGRMKGPDTEAIGSFARSVGVPVIASGGIGCLEDLVKVKRTGVYGVVVGMALYERKFTLERALEEVGR